jgi:hypothetical protein
LQRLHLLKIGAGGPVVLMLRVSPAKLIVHPQTTLISNCTFDYLVTHFFLQLSLTTVRRIFQFGAEIKRHKFPILPSFCAEVRTGAVDKREPFSSIHGPI